MATCLSLTFSPLQSMANTETPSGEVKLSESKEAETLHLRLNEINSLDKSNMDFSSKKALRKEVRSINQKLHDLGDGIYISAGAIIIILLLLIILF